MAIDRSDLKIRIFVPRAKPGIFDKVKEDPSFEDSPQQAAGNALAVAGSTAPVAPGSATDIRLVFEDWKRGSDAEMGRKDNFETASNYLKQFSARPGKQSCFSARPSQIIDKNVCRLIFLKITLGWN